MSKGEGKTVTVDFHKTGCEKEKKNECLSDWQSGVASTFFSSLILISETSRERKT